MLKVAWFLTLGLFTLSANADRIASGESDNLALTNYEPGLGQALVTMQLASFSTSSKPLTKPTTCKVFRNGGYVYLYLNDGKKIYQGTFGGGFPSELVDIEKPLKNGFTNHVETTSFGLTASWKAEYKNGVLKIESRIREIKDYVDFLEIRTTGSVIEATQIKWSSSGKMPSGDIKSNATCDEIPLS